MYIIKAVLRSQSRSSVKGCWRREASSYRVNFTIIKKKKHWGDGFYNIDLLVRGERGDCLIQVTPNIGSTVVVLSLCHVTNLVMYFVMWFSPCASGWIHVVHLYNPPRQTSPNFDEVCSRSRTGMGFMNKPTSLDMSATCRPNFTDCVYCINLLFAV